MIRVGVVDLEGGVSSSLLVFEMNDIIAIRSIHWAGEMLQQEAGRQ